MHIRGFNKNYIEFERGLSLKDDEIRPWLRDTLYHKPKDVSLKHANKMLLTFAFTRHPFSRLVSSYNDKMKHKKWNLKTHVLGIGEDIRLLRSNIMIKYRNVNPKKSNDYPTPKEFVTYLIEQVKLNGPLMFNRHWRPQYALCPFCSLDFDYLGTVEDMNKHVDYLSGLLGFKVNSKGCFDFILQENIKVYIFITELMHINLM